MLSHKRVGVPVNPGETGMEFDYSAMRAAVFIMNADVSNWTRSEWNDFYPEIASVKQLSNCKCGECPDYVSEDWN